MSDEPRKAHEVLVERISQHAALFDRIPKSNAKAHEEWIRLDEACYTLDHILLPSRETMLSAIKELRKITTRVVDEHANDLIHGLVNEIERRMEATTPPMQT